MSLDKKGGNDDVENIRQISTDEINELLTSKDTALQEAELEENEVVILNVADGLSENCYNPFKAASDGTTEEKQSSMNSSVNNSIGPFADNRPICDCEPIRQLMANSDARFLLSLLPDMAEMNSKQKAIFKDKAIKLIDCAFTDHNLV